MGNTLPKPETSKVVERVFVPHTFNAAACCVNGMRLSMEDAHMMHVAQDRSFAAFGVFDGHGDATCSAYLAKYLPDVLEQLPRPFKEEDVVRACLIVDRAFMQGGVPDLSTDAEAPYSPPAFGAPDGGSTATFILLEPTSAAGTPSREQTFRAMICNVGDSRTIVVRNGKMQFETADHKPQLMSERSRIEKAGGIVRMNRVDGDLAVSRAFGDATFKMSNNIGPREQKVICVPDITTMEVRSGDVLALCCDGVFEDNAMTSQSVADAAWDFVLHGTAATTAMTAAAAAAFEARGAPLDHDLGVFCSRVCDYAIARGSKDNISSMIVTVGGAIPGAKAASQATDDAAASTEHEGSSIAASSSSIPTNPIEAYGEHSYVPSSIALFRRARNAQLAFERMAERAGVALPAALRMRYELLIHRRNLAPPQFSALQAMAFDNVDEADVAAELEFFGAGPTPGSEGDAWFERLLLQEEGKN